MDRLAALDNACVTGAPGIINLGGKTYLVGQPDQMDAANIAMFLKQTAKTRVDELQEDPAFKWLPVDVQESKLRAAAVKQTEENIPWSEQAIMGAFTTLQGVRFSAWTLLRKHQPGLGYDDVAALINEDNKLAVSIQLDMASGMAKLGNSAGLPG